MPRINEDDYYLYITNPFDDYYIEMMVSEIEEVATAYDFNEREKVEFSAAFVQNIPYTKDSDSTIFVDYPRYPIETIWEMGGDCEDKAIILASLLDEMGIQVSLVHFPKTESSSGHYGVGVAEIEDSYGRFWDHDGSRYYYIETIKIGLSIGIIPEEWVNITPEIQTVIKAPFLVSNWEVVERDNTSILEVNIQNIGAAKADDIYIAAGSYYYYAEFGESDSLPELIRSQQFDLLPDDSITVQLISPVMINMQNMLWVNVIYNDASVNNNYP
jgi:hypothetical protein